MSKELPYFKFIATEWLSGDIILESMELQGIFINICALYWKAGGRLAKAKLDARFRPHEYQELVYHNLVKVSDMVSISFLDEQLKELSDKRQRQIEGGRKGGLSSAKGKLKHTSSILDKDKDKDIDSTTDISKPDLLGKSGEPTLPLKTNGQLSFEDKWKLFLDMFNEVGGRKFKGDAKAKRQFKIRLKDYTGNEMREAVRRLYKDPQHRENNWKYATPEFITRPAIMERYVNQKD